MLANYARWYTFLPPQWSTIPPPLTPQIACYADHHTKVTKLASHDRAVTSVEVLDGEARVTELSQMLGSHSGATRTNALEMLQQANSWKESKSVKDVDVQQKGLR